MSTEIPIVLEISETFPNLKRQHELCKEHDEVRGWFVMPWRGRYVIMNQEMLCDKMLMRLRALRG